MREANFYNAIESGISLFISFLISFAVVGTFAYYHEKGVGELNLRNAHIALEEAFGDSAKIIWGIGLLAAGQSSTMTGTYAGQFVMEGFMDIKLPVWKRVAVTRSIAILPALVVTFFDNFDNVDTYLNILQAIQLPFALIPLIKFTSNEKIMGEPFANTPGSKYFAIGFGLVLFLINLSGLLVQHEPSALGTTLLVIVLIAYLSLIVVVIRQPVSNLQKLETPEEESKNAVVLVEEKEEGKDT